MVVTRDRRSAARRWLDALAGQAGVWVLDGELTEDDLLTSPYVAFGTHQEIAEHIQQIQSLTGVDYYTIFPHLLESFGPVLQIINQ
jgi:hypothetical protein